MSKTNILCIDGGGIKGIVSAIVLVRLEELIQQYSRDKNATLSDYFDLFAGTSTGAIMTTLYLCPGNNHRPKYRAKDVLDLYLNEAGKIFHKKPLYPINTFFGLFSSKYGNKRFEEVLVHYFGHMQMKDLLKPCLLTSYNTYTRHAAFFSTTSVTRALKTQFEIKDAVLSSTAAPTYFPPVNIKNRVCQDLNNCYIDGGVVANNPSMCALIEATKLPKRVELQNVFLLSVGSVCNPDPYEYKKVKKWGIAGWAVPMFQILMSGNQHTVHYQLNKLFDSLGVPNHYLRVELHVEEHVPNMDDISKESIEQLKTFGYRLVAKEEKRLAEFAKRLISQ